MIYRITLTDGEVVELHNPADMPDVVRIDTIAEPWIRATIFTPDDYLGRGDQALPGPPRRAERAELRGHAGPWWSTICRSTRWCSTSTTG